MLRVAWTRFAGFTDSQLNSQELATGLFKMLHALYAEALFASDVFVCVKGWGITIHAAWHKPLRLTASS